MSKKDTILKAMLSHPIIKEKYGFTSAEGVSVVGPTTNNLMIEAIRTMIKEVEIKKSSNDLVVKTLLTMLNE